MNVDRLIMETDAVVEQVLVRQTETWAYIAMFLAGCAVLLGVLYKKTRRRSRVFRERF